MKKYIISLLICLSVGISGVLTSCKNDIPTIDYVHESKYSANFEALIKAIKDQTIALETKIGLINDALKDTNTTLAEKLALIEEAINHGVGTYERYAQALIDAIDNLNATQDEKLKAICDILESNNATTAQKLADIEAAIEAGIGTYEIYAQALIDAIDKLNDTQDKKLQAIYEILNSNNASLAQKLADIEAAIKAGIGSYKEYAQALIDAIDAMKTSQADKLQAIYDVLKTEFASLELEVELLAAAIDKGFLNSEAAIEALQEAIVAELKSEKEDLATRLTNLKNALDAVKTSLDENFKLNAGAIGTLTDELVKVLGNNQTSVNTKIEAITTAIGALTDNIGNEYVNILNLLIDLIDAVKAGADYSEIIAAIKALVPQPEPEPFEPEFVDLGVSVLWATCNLGAEKPEQIGNYYGWGAVEPYEIGVDNTWKLYFKLIGGLGAAEEDCGKSTLDPLTECLSWSSGIRNTKYDAAAKTWGQCCMPLQEDFAQLLRNCDWNWDVENGVKGWRVSGNGNSIFLPVTGFLSEGKVESIDDEAGYYLTATPTSTYYYLVNCLTFYSKWDSWLAVGLTPRSNGCVIRPVQIKGR